MEVENSVIVNLSEKALIVKMLVLMEMEVIVPLIRHVPVLMTLKLQLLLVMQHAKQELLLSLMIVSIVNIAVFSPVMEVLSVKLKLN